MAASGSGAANISRGRESHDGRNRRPLEPAHGGQRGDADPDLNTVLLGPKVLRPGRRSDRSHRTVERQRTSQWLGPNTGVTFNLLLLCKCAKCAKSEQRRYVTKAGLA